MKYWLMKSEPGEFSIEDLEQRPQQREPWDGVRNYQARNMMRDDMRVGDRVLFYHSNCAEPGIVGTAKVVREAYPDFTAFDPEDAHFDPKSDPGNPRWYMVDVGFDKRFKRTVSLHEMKTYTELADMLVLRRGNRLSITPVTPEQWRFILHLKGI